MFVKKITFTNYLGIEKTKECHFQLTKTELGEIAFSMKGGFIANIQRMMDDLDEPELLKNFKKIIFMSYGEISPDGDRFMKSEEISRAFSETPAYDILMQELQSNEEMFSEFMHNIIPPDLAESLPEKFDSKSLSELLNSSTEAKPIEVIGNVEGNNT